MATHTTTPPGECRGGTAPSCRELLSAAGFTALAGIAAVAIAKPDAQAVEVLPIAHGADAELIALHDQFMVLQAQLDAIDAGEEHPTDDQLDNIIHAQADLLEDMHSLLRKVGEALADLDTPIAKDDR